MAELDDLIDGWIDGSLNIAEQGRLESLLDQDPASRNRFNSRLQVEGLLRQQVRLSTATATPSVTRLPWQFTAGFSAAALLALAFLLLPSYPSMSQPNDTSPHQLALSKEGPATPSQSLVPSDADRHRNVRTITVLVRQDQTTISQHRETTSARVDFTLKLRP